MINKQMYEAPEAELIVISLEEQFLESILTTRDSGFEEKGNVKDLSEDDWGW